ATICGRCSRTDSRTFSSWRSQSRAPRENSSYHFVRPGGPGFAPLSPMCPTASFVDVALLLRQQRGDVTQRFLRAVLVVTILGNEPLLYHRNLLTRLFVRPRRRGHETQHVAAFLEEVLLDRLAHACVARKLELLARLEGDHRLADHLLPEGELARIGDLDLLLHRAQEALVGRALLARDRIAHLTVIER